MVSGVYAIRSRSGKMYIGSAQRLEQRRHAHFTALRDGTHHSPRLSGAWAKYQGEGFEFIILEECPAERLKDREQHHVDLLKPAYNVRIDVRSNVGLKASKASKAKMSEARKAYLADPANREKVRAKTLASWRDPEIAEKRRAAMKGKMTAKGRAKVGAAAKARGAMQKAQANRWSDPEARKRQSEAIKAARARRVKDASP